jgi:hypothetical protein
MAAPNIVNVAGITGKTALFSLTTSTQSIITNSTGSNTAVKVGNIIVSNVNGSNPATVNFWVTRSGTNYYIAYAISVPAGTTFVAMDKSTSIYLEEGDTLQAVASINSYLQTVVAYEVIS